jgi:hypothetical protein
MRKRKGAISLGAICVLAVGMLLVVHADSKQSGNTVHFAAKLSGFQELGALNSETGAILTDGSGTLQLTLDKAAQTISYELTYSGLSAPVTQSHIHFGRVHVPGGIMVFFCSNLTTPAPPAGTQACPSSGGTITGMWSATNVQGIAGQNVTAGDFDALTDALFSNSAYANVHTTKFPAGEIRGQVHKGDGAGRGTGDKE